MDSVPGPSRTKGDSPKQPNKKRKCDDEGSSENKCSSTTIDDLPEEMLLEIFKYLSIPDKLRVQRVCTKWYQTIKSEVLWKHVVLMNVYASWIIRIVRILPSCVLHFECHNCRERRCFPISLPEFMAKLHERCPSLKTVILVNVVFLNCDSISSPWFKFFKSDVGDSASKIIESEFKKEGNIGELNAVLPELTILSLKEVYEIPRFSPFFSCFLLPKLTVLDSSNLSYFSKSPDKGNLLFPPLHDLEELYLSGSNFSNNELHFLISLKKLRVLDLAFTDISGDVISVLQENCTCLEELYLCCTGIGNDPVTSETKVFFPHLHTLCLSYSSVSREYIKEILITCPSLKFVNASGCKNVTEMWCRSLSKDLQEKIQFRSHRMEINNHFFKKTRWHRLKSALCKCK